MTQRKPFSILFEPVDDGMWLMTSPEIRGLVLEAATIADGCSKLALVLPKMLPLSRFDPVLTAQWKVTSPSFPDVTVQAPEFEEAGRRFLVAVATLLAGKQP